jgi:hypothetical protein
VAQDQVARAARQQAHHRAGQVREQRPPRHGLAAGGAVGAGAGECVRGCTVSVLQMQSLSDLLQ